MFGSPEYDTDYVIVRRVDPVCDRYSMFLSDDIRICDVIRLRPDYSGGGPWSFDHPVQIDAVRTRDGKTVAQMQTLGVEITFSLDPEEERCSYLIATPENAEALMAGVPSEDVFC